MRLFPLHIVWPTVYHNITHKNSVQPDYNCHASIMYPPPTPRLKVFQMQTIYNPRETPVTYVDL